MKGMEVIEDEAVTAKLRTIGDLIDHLSQYPRDMRVVTRGFDEGGYDDFSCFEEVRIAPVKKTSHGPDYDDHPHYRPGHEIGEPFDALLVN
jgi:hypothetical protein